MRFKFSKIILLYRYIFIELVLISQTKMLDLILAILYCISTTIFFTFTIVY